MGPARRNTARTRNRNRKLKIRRSQQLTGARHAAAARQEAEREQCSRHIHDLLTEATNAVGRAPIAARTASWRNDSWPLRSECCAPLPAKTPGQGMQSSVLAEIASSASSVNSAESAAVKVGDAHGAGVCRRRHQ